MKHIYKIKSYSCILLLAYIIPIFAQDNFIQNSGFDNDLNSWTLSGPTSPVWDAFDADNNPNSGSAFIKNTDNNNNSDIIVLSQCFPHTSNAYTLGSWVYIPNNQISTGYVVLSYVIRLNSNNCTGGWQAGGGGIVSNTGQWELATASIAYQDAGVGSIEYIIRVYKTEATGEFVAYIDDAYLFSDIIFKNSFE